MKKLNKKAMPLALLVVALTAFGMGNTLSPITSIGTGDSLTEYGVICVCKNSPTNECYEGMTNAVCQHNAITDWGKNATRTYMTTNIGGARGNFTILALSNTSGATSYNFTTELTGGLGRGLATIANNQPNGNWSLVKTFTADAQFLSVNTTGIYNNSVAGTCCMFAGGYFSAVNLESGDTLTVNYTLAVV